MLTPLKSKPLRERMLAQLRQKIFSGEYPPGYEMNPESLAEEFGCSRMPIREALQILAEEGLIIFLLRGRV